MNALLPRNMLIPFLTKISKKLEIIAPVIIGDVPVFCTWNGQDVAFDENPLYPPTEFLLPHKETLFKYVQESGRYTFEEDKPKPRLLLGIRPCDLRAATVLDRIFSEPPRDHHYLSKRRATLMAVLNCTKSVQGCMCAQLGSGPEVKDEYDLLITEIEPGYLVEAGSPAGILLMSDNPEFFQEATDAHLAEKSKLMKKASEQVKSHSDISLQKMKDEIKRADWASLGKECFNCGGCTFVCPVCHCFNILDLGIPDGERIRCRDTCILSGFSRLAGGSNPRKSPGERMKNWYMDKFEYIPQKTGLAGCVGCGRCQRVCMAEIDRWKLEAAK
jgi:sulfhydrogenase subunit beta (sulfur reductase)